MIRLKKLELLCCNSQLLRAGFCGVDSGGDGDTAVNRMLTATPAGLVKFMEQIKAATGIDLADVLKEVS